MCRRLQLALVAVGHAPFGPEGCFFAPTFIGADAAHQRRAFTIQFEQSEFPLERGAQLNFAGPTKERYKVALQFTERTAQ